MSHFFSSHCGGDCGELLDGLVERRPVCRVHNKSARRRSCLRFEQAFFFIFFIFYFLFFIYFFNLFYFVWIVVCRIIPEQSLSQR
jgi:hypothetical protein